MELSAATRPASLAALSPAARARRFASRLLALDLLGIGQVLAPLLVLAVALSQPVDTDYWWHRRTGQYILQHFTVPASDPFAFTTTGKYWLDHEWLSQVLMYGVDAAPGYLGLFLCSFALGVAAWLLIYRLLRYEGIARGQAFGLSLAPLVIGASYWRARPAMFTVFFLALLLSELFAARRGERRTLWRLAPLMVLWANLHGGYVIGLVVLGLFAASQWWDRRLARGPGWKHAFGLTAVAFVATGINPYTWRIWLYPFTYFVGGNASLAAIDEWQSPNFHELRNLPLALLLVGALLAGGSGRRFDFWRSSVLVVFGLMALQSLRHQALFAIVWPPVIGISLAERWSWWKRDLRISPGVASVNWGLVAGCAAALVVVVAMAPRGLPLRQAPTGGSMAYPAAGAAYIERELPGARIFNEYSWGGYLIDRLYPEHQVFIDGRADLHGELLVRYRAIVQGMGWQAAFDEYKIDAAILPPGMPLVADLEQAGWRAGYRDAGEVVLVAPPTR